MFELLVGSFGFRTTFKVTFEKLLKTPLGSTTLPLPTIVPITRSFFEAEATVRMNSTGSGSTFDLTIYGLGNDIFTLLEPQKTVVHLTLGYDDGDTSEVIEGLLTEKSLKAGESFYEAHLSGVDFVFDQLLNPPKNIKQTYPKQAVKLTAGDICGQANVSPNIKADGPTLDSITFNDVTPLDALRDLARRSGFALQAKDGKLWMGDPATLGETRLAPLDDGATGRPVTARGATPGASALEGFDFAVAGVPALRPSDLIQIADGHYRVESVTHVLAREGGYQCKGRALSASASHDDIQAAAKGNPAQVARQLQQNAAQREAKRPAVSAGEVNEYTPGQHTTTVDVGHDATPAMVNPTTQAPLRKDPVALPDKPMASPFAFHKCGLVVPVYPKMRTLLVHGWNEPNDAVIDGFLWTDKMTPPANQAGDWWLCLPTAFDGDGLPTGNGVDDLTDQGGERVIQVKGLRITVGAGLLNPVGTRPTPASDESVTIETDKGAKVTIKGQTIEMSAGGVTLSIGNGKVSVS
ncbi:MAG TPA: hypothetical protein VG406_13745 [Isosphaeraceae bacterium]|nr:hypothetical protein [Isosphaeraceae bacterium]